MVPVTRFSAALPRFFVRFYDADGVLLDVSVALPCPAAALDAAADVAAERFGYVPQADVHPIH